MDHIELIGCDSLICWARDCGSRRYSDDHCYVRLGQCDCDDDGDSGRVFGNAVADESLVLFVG